MEKKRQKEIIASNVAFEGDLLVSRRVNTEKLPFEKETSFPTSIFQGLCENMGAPREPEGLFGPLHSEP